MADPRLHTSTNSGRRRFLALALLPLPAFAVDFKALLGALRKPSDSFEDWFHAARLDDVTRIRQLLERGFDPNTVEPERFDTALIVAVREGSMRVFTLLMETPDIDLDAQSLNGDTALMIAAFKSNLPAARALVEQGAEINRPGWTPLHYAAAAGNNEIVALMLLHHAYIDAESPNKTTPLMMAARGGHMATVTLLLDEGADLIAQTETGLNALDFARSQGHDALGDFLSARLSDLASTPQ